MINSIDMLLIIVIATMLRSKQAIHSSVYYGDFLCSDPTHILRITGYDEALTLPNPSASEKEEARRLSTSSGVGTGTTQSLGQGLIVGAAMDNMEK